MNELSENPQYKDTMAALERVKRSSADGTDYWMARDIHLILGYPTWREFESVIERATEAFRGNGIDPSHQIVLTHKMMEIGKGARRPTPDYFLSRPACYLIALNGDPSKAEIAAAQAYFVIRTRESELRENDEKRDELRAKVAEAHKLVSGVAKDAGVRNHMQGVFHDARLRGLYGMGAKEVKRRKGLAEDGNLFDHAGPLELSMNEFQMNLAADVMRRKAVRGEQRAIETNHEVALHVRKSVEKSSATMPEDLPLEAEPIQKVRKRIAERQKRLPPSSSSSS